MDGRRARVGLLALASSIAALAPAGALAADFPARPVSLGPIPDLSSRDVVFDVSGLSVPVQGVQVSFNAIHPWVGDLEAVLIAPSGEQQMIFSRPGHPTTTFGSAADLNGTYTFSDAAPDAPSWESAATANPMGTVFAGGYRAATADGVNTFITPTFAATPPNGTWTLRMHDYGGADNGSVSAAVLTIAAPAAQSPPPPAGDTDPPEATITKGAPNKTTRHRVKFKFESNEPGSTFECKKDKNPWKPCTSPTKMKRLDEGPHKFKVRATDPAGNTGKPAKDTFKVLN